METERYLGLCMVSLVVALVAQFRAAYLAGLLKDHDDHYRARSEKSHATLARPIESAMSTVGASWYILIISYALAFGITVVGLDAFNLLGAFVALASTVTSIATLRSVLDYERDYDTLVEMDIQDSEEHDSSKENA